ncbi:ABC integral membrane type 1 [Fusarium denticulatum]|uniref:ABC integral membrane type 1 n=1 Tax=Fusarium denticulatum TaxID=48507 RepID=A0A8H5WH94_9HYPO|nr:ABC integral membrane type 1 [Fusarium denticulatum]
MVFQVLVLLVENVEKSRLLLESYRYSPEPLAGPLARLLFSWLMPLLRLGYDTILSMATLTPLSEDLKSQQLEPKLVRFLKDAKSSTLLRELFRLRRGLLLPIIPRMLLLGFTLAQPFLIYTAVSYTSINHNERSIEEGNLLVAAFVLTFLGYAVIFVAATVPVTQKIGTAQGSWNAAIEKRVNLTSAILSNLKEVRILGIAPISVLIQSLPSFAAGLSSLSRIESFVSLRTSSVRRTLHDEMSSFTAKCFYSRGPEADSSILGHELGEVKATNLCYKSSGKDVGNSIVIRQAKFGWEPDSYIINTGDFEIQEGALTVIMGPVGSGKSTLLYGLLDETPWLVSGSIRHNITCGAVFDEPWYNKVLDACSLVHDLDHLSGRDMHEVGNDGSSLSGGQRKRRALARAIYVRNPVLFLDNPLSGVDHGTAAQIAQALFGSGGLLRSGGITVLIVTGSRDITLHADNALVMDQEGSVTITREPTNVDSPIMVATSTKDYIEVTNDEQSQGQAGDSTAAGPRLELTEAKADLRRPTGDWSIYSFYAHATGRYNTCFFFCLCLCCAFCYQFSTVWIQWWSDATNSTGRKSNGFYLGIYALLCALGLSTLYLACWTSMVTMVTRSAIKLHLMVLTTVFNAHVSYFSTIDDGITLNRFNQDMQLTDYTLPLAVVNTFLFASICLVQAAVISATANYMAAAIPFCLVVIYFIQRFYLRTSRQLRLLDIEAKAPLSTNFKETILGMNTIRAYGGEFGSFLKEKHVKVLDDSQQPIYLLYTVQRWLSLVLDLVVACLATILIVVAVQTRSGTSGSDMGVALVNLTSFNQYLTMLIRCWASMETSLGAIARIKDFSHETPVADGCGHEPQPDYEGDQSIVFKDVSVVYRKPKASFESAEDSSEDTSDLNLNHQALDSVNLTIRPGTKLAITGRSGSGKSTLVSSLFRILPLSSGTISIGGFDIAQVDQQVIQDRLIAITQSNFFLSGISLRENLDPSGSSGEEGEGSTTPLAEVMKEVLDSMEIWSQLEERGGLEGLFSQSSWSVGQLQLLSVARAIIKKRRTQSHPGLGWKTLVLDEVTSSLDETSARVVRDRIKVEFEDYTILSIVHKFDGVIEDIDEIIIMDQGRVTRRGPPRQLLQAV